MSDKQKENVQAPKEETKEETKEQKSIRLANSRVNKAIKAIDMVKNLATPNYAFTGEQKKKIVNALSDAVVELDNSFDTMQVVLSGFCL